MKKLNNWGIELLPQFEGFIEKWHTEKILFWLHIKIRRSKWKISVIWTAANILENVPRGNLLSVSGIWGGCSSHSEAALSFADLPIAPCSSSWKEQGTGPCSPLGICIGFVSPRMQIRTWSTDNVRHNVLKAGCIFHLLLVIKQIWFSDPLKTRLHSQLLYNESLLFSPMLHFSDYWSTAFHVLHSTSFLKTRTIFFVLLLLCWKLIESQISSNCHIHIIKMRRNTHTDSCSRLYFWICRTYLNINHVSSIQLSP